MQSFQSVGKLEVTLEEESTDLQMSSISGSTPQPSLAATKLLLESTTSSSNMSVSMDTEMEDS